MNKTALLYADKILGNYGRWFDKGLFCDTARVIKKHEGFQASPYDDRAGRPGDMTVGYGTRLPLTSMEKNSLAVFRAHEGVNLLIPGQTWPIDDEEGELLLCYRLAVILAELSDRLHNMGICPDCIPFPVKKALGDMAYNMGVPNLMGFRLMLRAIKFRDWEEAEKHAKDSLWASQVGEGRTGYVAGKFRKAAEMDPYLDDVAKYLRERGIV